MSIEDAIPALIEHLHLEDHVPKSNRSGASNEAEDIDRDLADDVTEEFTAHGDAVVEEEPEDDAADDTESSGQQNGEEEDQDQPT